MRDLVIIGAGPAGYTAAIYAARAGLAPLLFSGTQPGGQLTITTEVENYPGFAEPVRGPELMARMRQQAVNCGAEIVDATVERVELAADPKRLWVDGTTYEARSVVVATGASARWLGLPSEEKYRGKGVSACATCDGRFFRKQDVAVAGGGDTALEEALYLAGLARSVTLIHRRDEFRASRALQEEVKVHAGIAVLWSRTVEEVLGDETGMTGLRLKNVKSGEIEEKTFTGLFVAIGHVPNTALFRDQLPLDENGYIVVPDAGRTATGIPGVFAAGDVRDSVYRQAVTAAAMGCMAAIEAERFLRRQ